jgi:hypothetical protein
VILPNYVVALVTAVNHDGRQEWLRFYASTNDHEEAALQAFEFLGAGARRIVQIETFDGPGRTWDPDYEVNERLIKARAVSAIGSAEASSVV